MLVSEERARLEMVEAESGKMRMETSRGWIAQYAALCPNAEMDECAKLIFRYSILHHNVPRLVVPVSEKRARLDMAAAESGKTRMETSRGWIAQYAALCPDGEMDERAKFIFRCSILRHNMPLLTPPPAAAVVG